MDGRADRAGTGVCAAPDEADPAIPNRGGGGQISFAFEREVEKRDNGYAWYWHIGPGEEPDFLRGGNWLLKEKVSGAGVTVVFLETMTNEDGAPLPCDKARGETFEVEGAAVELRKPSRVEGSGSICRYPIRAAAIGVSPDGRLDVTF